MPAYFVGYHYLKYRCNFFFVEKEKAISLEGYWFMRIRWRVFKISY